MKRQTVSTRSVRVNKSRLVNFLIVCAVLCYVIYVFTAQGTQAAANEIKISDLESRIELANAEHERLLTEREMADTPEYKEHIARERGGLIMPDELMFIDPLEN